MQDGGASIIASIVAGTDRGEGLRIMTHFQEMFETAKQVMLTPEAAMTKARAEGRDAMSMARVLTIPLVIICSIAALLLGMIFYGSLHGASFIIQQAVMQIMFGIGSVFLVAFLADYFAGMFGGSRNFDAAFSAVALASVPSVLGMIAGLVPRFGGVISLALSIYSLILLYRAFPIFLTVPVEQRTVHYLATLGTALVVMFAVSAAMGGFGGFHPA